MDLNLQNAILLNMILILISLDFDKISIGFDGISLEILSKSNGIHGIYPMKSHQIQWKSYQNLMGFMGFMGFIQ